MSKLKILAGDIPRGTTFYTVPGAIRGLVLQEVLEADQDKVTQLLGRKLRGLGRQICFVAVFTSGEQALVQTDPGTLLRIESDLARGPVSRESVQRAAGNNSRMAILFCVLFLAAWVVLGNQVQGWMAFILSAVIGMAGAVAGSVLWGRFRGEG